ncbi:MAG: acyl-CoA dehydrogenase family protein [Acidimicrobiia bacterium]
MYVFSEEQNVLRKTAAEVGRTNLTPANGRASASDDETAAAWSLLHDLGWTTILLPTDAGGSGGSLVDACIIAEGLAISLAAVPFVAPCVVVPSALELCGSEANGIGAALVSGSMFSLALNERLDLPAAGRAVAWDWARDAILLHVDGRRLTTVDAPVVPLTSVDVLHPMGRSTVSLRGEAPTDTAVIARLRAVARVANSAALTGYAAGALTMALEHARSREQFGRSIGSFQALQHLLADMHVAVESSRSVTYAAAWTTEHLGLADVTRTSASAFVWCARAAVTTCENAVQVLGGIGVTEESIAHLYLRGAHLLARMFGGEVSALDELARPLIDRARGGGSVEPQ